MTPRTWVAFALLCILSGSAWLLDAALPAALPGVLSLLVNNAVLAAIFFLFCGGKISVRILPILAYAALIVAVPGALSSLAGGRLSSTTIVLVYTLVPAAIVFFAAQATQEDLLSLLGPALAGVAGAALILPFALPASLAGAFWLAAIVLSAIAAAFAALRLHTLLAATPILPAAALAAVASTLITLPLYLYERPTLVLLTWPQALLSQSIHLALHAATLVLTVRLLRDAEPIAFSTRYLLVPLVTIAEGYVLLHPTATWTLPAGALLLAGASALLLRVEHQG